ncbi:hypothetical protein LSH36_1010g00000 [Paralvinella palmiformis]|uniref:Uncharacterized protein n=1 Tax=Paralvinella palmiformis TaxID=53620 RepID=A0AAD9MQ94_9ANNE|nr:hypothetical protein LSH36_1010g00000 [Paralvinella palmiformis]
MKHPSDIPMPRFELSDMWSNALPVKSQRFDFNIIRNVGGMLISSLELASSSGPMSIWVLGQFSGRFGQRWINVSMLSRIMFTINMKIQSYNTRHCLGNYFW